MNSAPQFLLVGNGPFTNRGCEAIIRGTTTILDAVFGGRAKYVTASFGSEACMRTQAQDESFSRLRHELISRKGRFTPDNLKAAICRRFQIKHDVCMYNLPGGVSHWCAALQVGGDNYSLDYGYPLELMEIDRYLHRRGVPLVLWGASVGPFGKDPEFEREMTVHLSKFCLITVREAKTFRYLMRLGLTNIVQVADPAFMMDPQSVHDVALPPEYLGINLSPLTAARVTSGDVKKWSAICAIAVARVLAECDLPVLLIPHVASQRMDNDDHSFLQSVARAVNSPCRVQVLGGDYTAAQLKWIIGKCAVFAGARTHSTIASISMGVPTLSLAYSVKAWGINEDVFGHIKYCMDVRDLLQENALATRLIDLLKQNDDIRRALCLRLPALRSDALRAGVTLMARLRANK